MSVDVRYFADCAGSIAQLHQVRWIPLVKQPGQRIVRDYGRMAAGICTSCGQLHTAARVIHYNKQPSMHQCNALCMSARGPNCECRCGGKNHGAGFVASGELFGSDAFGLDVAVLA